MKKICLLSICFIFLFSGMIYAQIVLDGTMGTAGQIKGSPYEIMEKYGQRAGANLFHSFSQFNVNTGEIADFNVSSDVQNIISRVTGGEHSWIDGKLRSTISETSQISGANLYLLNPAGVVFGANATLDIGGSFHVSTADYLRMGENERFYVNQDTAVLSTAPPAAFGFLDSTINNITFEGSGQKETNTPAGLTVSNGNTLSVIGGNIEIKGSYTLNEGDKAPLGNLNAPEGRINMASVASSGEVIPTDTGLDVSSFREMGKITLSDGAQLNVSATESGGSGNVYIRSGQFVLNDYSEITADSKDMAGGVTDIQADTLSLSKSSIYSDAQGTGKGGGIVLRIKDDVALSDASRVFADTTGADADAGDAGSVRIETQNLRLTGGSIISSETEDSTGNGGSVVVSGKDDTFAESVEVSDSKIYSGAIRIDNAYPKLGDGGSVYLKAKQISFTDGGIIGSESTGTGKGGNITLEASESLHFSGEGTDGPSKAYTAAFGNTYDAGDAGNIWIKAGKVSFEGVSSEQALPLDDQVGITAGTMGPGNAGTITIETGSLQLDANATIASASESEGEGGNAGAIFIHSDDTIYLNDYSTITTATAGIKNGDKGNAGDITIEAAGLRLNHSSFVSSESTSASQGGDAGNITLDMNGSMYVLNGSAITTEAEDAGKGQIDFKTDNWVYLFNGDITTSIKKGGEDAGNIKGVQNVMILNHSEVKADAWGGDGGNIHLIADPFTRSSDSGVHASSMYGFDGTVYIEAPDSDVSSALTILPSSFIDVTRWLQIPCVQRSGESVSRFLFKGRDAVPTPLDDWLPGPLFGIEK